MNEIKLDRVTRRFGETLALDDVSLTFGGEKIYALLGRNGAGKSTLLRLIANRDRADSGAITLDGEPVWENDAAQGKLYLMSETTCYPEGMRIHDAFAWTARFYDSFDADFAAHAAEQFGLDGAKKVKSLSTGYTSIFKLIIALSVGTPYLLLDEPVLGLDAGHRDLFYHLLIERYAERPSTVVISTHLIEEISALVEEVVIIDRGRILRAAAREDLLAEGCSVTGAAGAVVVYLAGCPLVGADTLGGLKTAYLLGEPPAPVPDGIEIGRLDLQRLFVKMTDAKEERK